MIYELTYLITPELTDEEAEKLQKSLLEEIKTLGASIKKIEEPKRRELAYPIEKQNAAYLASLDFTSDKKCVISIKEKLDKSDKILRYLLITKKEMKEEEKKERIKPREKPKKEEEPKRRSSKKSKKVKLKEIDDKIEDIL